MENIKDISPLEEYVEDHKHYFLQSKLNDS